MYIYSVDTQYFPSQYSMESVKRQLSPEMLHCPCRLETNLTSAADGLICISQLSPKHATIFRFFLLHLAWRMVDLSQPGRDCPGLLVSIYAGCYSDFFRVSIDYLTLPLYANN